MKWFCPANRSHDFGPWCDGLPCKGHRTNKQQLLVARVIAWTDGFDEWDARAEWEQQRYAQHATLCLFDLGII